MKFTHDKIKKTIVSILVIIILTSFSFFCLFAGYSFRFISPSLRYSILLTQKALLTHGHPVVEGRNGWLFYRQGFAYEIRPWPKQNIAVISELNNILREYGIRLIVVPVPDKSDVYPEFLNLGDPSIISIQREKFLKGMNKNKVNTIDLLPIFHATKYQDPLYFKYDSHWNQRGIVTAAKSIAKELTKLEPDLPKIFDLQTKDTFGGRFQDLYTILHHGTQDERENLAQWETVQFPDRKPLKNDITAPIMVFGDSFTEIGQGYGAQLSAHIAQLSGIPAYTFFSLSANVDGPPMLLSYIKRAKVKPKVVVWVFISHALQMKFSPISNTGYRQ
jgi:hypothetical protein